MIVVDGRTDLEKLRELLPQPEQTHLEFKSSLDLVDNRARVEFVKDAVSMSNRPPGGYILIGAHEGGALSLPRGTIQDPALFDGARLGDLIRKYIEGEVHLISQFHALDDHEVVLIYIPHHRDGLPVPMSATGQWRKPNGTDTVVFREGEVLVREGAKNTPLRHAHWHDLLSQRDRRLREEARQQSDLLLAELAKALRNGPSTPAAIPLAADSSDDAFVQALISNFESNSDVRIRQFLAQAKSSARDESVLTEMLNKITILAAQALFFEQVGLAGLAVDSLYDIYDSSGADPSKTRLDIINRVYVLGSLAVRLRIWPTIPALVLRPYPPMEDGYVYSSWIRHGQVAASRGGLFPAGRGGLMISAARELAAEHHAMRPDVPDAGLPDPGQMADNDTLFNSLCQFDVLLCMVIAAEGQHHGGGYPASSAMHQHRADPAFILAASDSKARAALFPTSTDETVASAMAHVFSSALRESHSFGGHWWSLPSSAQRFVDEHASEVGDL